MRISESWVKSFSSWQSMYKGRLIFMTSLVKTALMSGPNQPFLAKMKPIEMMNNTSKIPCNPCNTPSTLPLPF